MLKFLANKVIFSALAAAAISLNFTPPAAAGVDDAFGSARQIEGRHFSVYYAPELDPLGLAEQLDISAGERVLAGNTSRDKSFGLADALDTLFTRVCGILDMQLYSYHGKIKICRDQAHLAGIYRQVFGKDLGNARSFYIFEFNTIYVSAANFRKEVIGHEMGHAAACNYFVVQPSVKIQEVLACYVEYQLRK